MDPHAIAVLGLLVGAAAAAASPTSAGEPDGGNLITFALTPEEQCAEGELLAGAGSLAAAIEGSRCVLRAGTDAAGLLDAFFGLFPAVSARIPQPPDFFGFFREAEVSTSFLVPEPPPPGTEAAVAQVLNHLIVVWLLEPEGIALVPVGDPILHFNPPAPPPYLAGRTLGAARYGEPFEVTVAMSTSGHRITVAQSGRILAAATLKKIFTHPDALSHASLFQAVGDLDDYTIWSLGPAAFRGVRSEAEVIIGASDEPSRRFSISGIERTPDGAAVRLD
jgi:hypothetical protein